MDTIFSGVVETVGIWKYEDSTVDTSHIDDPLLKAIRKYKNHPTVRLIKGDFKNLSTFSFHYVN